MELLSPEFLGGAGVTVGGIGLGVFIKFVFDLGGLKKSVEHFLTEMTITMKRSRTHQDREEEHHKRVETLGKKIEAHLKPAPRVITSDHTPVRGVELPSG